MAVMDKVDSLKRQVLEAGGEFVRYSSNGHAIYQLGTYRLSFPGRHLGKSHGHMLRNLEQDVRRALKAAPPVVTRPTGPERERGLTAQEVDALPPEPVRAVPVPTPNGSNGHGPDEPPTPPAAAADPLQCRWCPRHSPSLIATRVHEKKAHRAAFEAAGGSQKAQVRLRYAATRRLVCEQCGFEALTHSGLNRHRGVQHRGAARATVRRPAAKATPGARPAPPAPSTDLGALIGVLDEAGRILRAAQKELQAVRTENAGLRTRLQPFLDVVKTMQALG
jgi:hypothetical protein